MRRNRSSLTPDNRTARRPHPYKRRESGSISPTSSEKENHPQKSNSAEGYDKKNKTLERSGGGNTSRLEEIQRRFCPKEIKIKLERLQLGNQATCQQQHPFKIEHENRVASSSTFRAKEYRFQTSQSAERYGEKKNNSEKSDGGTASRLEEMRQRHCPKEARIELERLRCKEIMVTIPNKGLREVYYCSFESESEEEEDETKDEEDATVISNRNSSDGQQKYEDWRVQTIQAFPASVISKDRDDDLSQDEDNEDNSPARAVTYFIDIPSTHDYVFSVANCKDDLHSILDILAGDKMSTLIIDAYLKLRLAKYYKDSDQMLARRISVSGKENYEFRNKKPTLSIHPLLTPVNFQYLSVNFMPVKDREQPISTFKTNSLYLPDLTEFTENSNAQLIAPLYASKHLYLAVFDFREKVVTAYDSSWHFLPMELREGQINTILRSILNQAGEEVNDYSESLFSQWKIDWKKKSCPQYDEYSCGIYTIHYAENVLRGIADHKHWWKLSHKRVMQIRRHIVKELLFTTSVGRQFLYAISG